MQDSKCLVCQPLVLITRLGFYSDPYRKAFVRVEETYKRNFVLLFVATSK